MWDRFVTVPFQWSFYERKFKKNDILLQTI